MNIGVVGLGLIGGSVAAAMHGAGHTVYGTDRDHAACSLAVVRGLITDFLTDDRIAACEALVIALYPEETCAWLREHRDAVAPGTLVMDTAGVKQAVCDTGFELAKERGITFVGIHPVAGSEKSGTAAATPDLFRGACCVMVPPVYDDIRLLERVKQTLSPLGFGKWMVTTAEKHDRIIAYTSQLPHVISNAYVQNPTFSEREGFSGGSFRDLTRTAALNAPLWSQLFLENRESLTGELDRLIATLTAYRTAISENDPARLEELIAAGERNIHADRSR